MSSFSHYPVLFEEVMEGLSVLPDGVYVDCTAGGGGHSSGIACRLSEKGRLIAIDRDAEAISAAKDRLRPYSDRVFLFHSNFSSVRSVIGSLNIEGINGALIDLGVSSYQLDTASRGFSYMQNAPLDMRMDKDSSLSAYDVVNSYDEAKIRKVLFEYGEESFAPKIASAIVKSRSEKPIETTFELVDVIKKALPAKALNGGHHPAKKSFQAIRIEVNGELDVIAPTLEELVGMLKKGGRLAVITFHSLEDRIVKKTFATLCAGCICPPDFPACVCGRKPVVRLVNKKPILPSARELEENPRSRSAKLRIVEKL